MNIEIADIIQKFCNSLILNASVSECFKLAWRDFLEVFDIEKLGISEQPTNATLLIIRKQKVALTNLLFLKLLILSVFESDKPRSPNLTQPKQNFHLFCLLTSVDNEPQLQGALETLAQSPGQLEGQVPLLSAK